MRNMICLGKEVKKFWIKRALFIPVIFATGVLILGSVVMYLWNAILPAVLCINTITFWQAVGILVLSKILFGGFHGRHDRRGFHDHGKDMREKWMSLSPEEKEKMRKKWWGRFEHQAKQDAPENTNP
jgi:Ca2+/H+ antiporter, TMEM165/GDT1 family